MKSSNTAIWYVEACVAGKMWIGTACNVQVCVPMGVQVGREGRGVGVTHLKGVSVLETVGYKLSL